jgi:2-C-methyl-D-erythritol 4-phosphate cytidylyltransferase/2-C-methyl-D-erythritol 2,4-cyclodiphosphate synthase
MTDVRVGQGFDVHRYAVGRRLVLCGLELGGEVGLEGHSDADVALHAVTDALLGAVAEGDLGVHFSPDDARWRHVPSTRFLELALDKVAGHGLVVSNCDLTLVGERPRITPHREALRGNLARLLGVPTGRVSVKATTTEGLGFTGRREGLAALAVVVLVDGPE